MIKLMLIAGAGGFAGTCCRFLTGWLCGRLFDSRFPIGTLAANIAGCFIAGILFGLAEKGGALNSRQTALLITGFCGGFTTYSAFANDIFTLGAKGDWIASCLYLAISVILGIIMIWAGRAVVA